ncbi:FtsW/RodA/SpoVE family cell cycle protein [Aerococcaceae bacterium DSM 111176]|nr:FtsW/RodA/SpoVE family cell cycle protein [Aerococcaceae bacterium DSM 111176]
MKEKNTSSSKPTIPRVLNYIDLQVAKIKFGLDWPLFLSTLTLIIIGLVMVFSATTSIGVNGEVTDPVGHFQTQLISAALGFLIGAIMFFIPSNFFKEYQVIRAGLLLILGLLIYVFFFGIEAGGAKSWMAIGSFSFQPSEFLKLAVIFAISWILVQTERIPNLTKDKYQKKDTFWLYGLLFICIIFIIFQSDYGMTLIVFATGILLVSLSIWSIRLNLIGFIGVLVLIVAVSVLVQLFLGDAGDDRFYILNRIISYVDPFKYADTFGFQLIQGYQAIVNGGLFGRGLGQSLMKHDGRLPAAENDFILAILIEEFGIVGGLAVLGLFFFVIFRLIWWSTNSKDSYRSKVLLGIGILLFVQVCVNVGGMLGLIPLSGVTLPFISEGGSSMLMYMMTLAIALRAIIEEKNYQKNLLEEVEYDI